MEYRGNHICIRTQPQTILLQLQSGIQHVNKARYYCQPNGLRKISAYQYGYADKPDCRELLLQQRPTLCTKLFKTIWSDAHRLSLCIP